MKTTINVPSGTKYLSNVISELPHNCLFDKGRVGCGGTTTAINSKENYIICVPFVSLIENKVSQHDNILGIYKGITDLDIVRYLSLDGIKKILITYDSLPRIINMIDTKEYNILVDEYHLLFTQYSFRRDAAKSVLSNYSIFKSYCFMTATPIEQDFLLDELRGLDIVEAIWEDTKEVNVNSVQCVNTSVDGTVFNLVDRFISGEVEGNAYIFVNSVEFMKDIVTNCGLDENNCRVVYSKQNKTRIGIKRGDSTDKPKKINILTSTVFEGADFYDRDGKIFIVSDNRKTHTLTDISTSFQQIAGRIRNTRYWDTITHIFTTTRYYNDLSYEEFKEVAFKQIDLAYEAVEELNGLSESIRSKVSYPIESYVSKADDIFSFDANLLKIDLYNFKICKSIYKLRVNITEELLLKGYNVSEHSSYLKTDVIRLDSDAKSFKETIEEIRGLKKHDELYIGALEKYPFLLEAINKLGFDGIENESYIITNVKRKLIYNLDCSNEVKVAKNLKLTNKFSTGEFVTAKEAKETVATIYSQFGIKKTANIRDFYEVKESVKRLNGKLVKGYIVIMPKVILNDIA